MYWGDLLCESAVALASHSLLPGVKDVLSRTIQDFGSRAHNVRITSWWLTGCALMTCGAAIRLLCYRELGRLFTWELSIKKDHTLITSGPYSIVRHPSYVGSVLVGVGTILCHFGPGSWYKECIGWDSLASKVFTAVWAGWSLVLPILLMGRVNNEDEILRREFRGEWEAYAKKNSLPTSPVYLLMNDRHFVVQYS